MTLCKCCIRKLQNVAKSQSDVSRNPALRKTRRKNKKALKQRRDNRPPFDAAIPIWDRYIPECCLNTNGLPVLDSGRFSAIEDYIKRPFSAPDNWTQQRLAQPKVSSMLFANSIGWNRRHYEPGNHGFQTLLHSNNRKPDSADVVGLPLGRRSPQKIQHVNSAARPAAASFDKMKEVRIQDNLNDEYSSYLVKGSHKTFLSGIVVMGCVISQHIQNKLSRMITNMRVVYP